MLIHNKMDLSTVNGPGNRAVIWFQGCSLGCKGCWNQETHSFDAIKDVPVYELVDWVVNNPHIEGVTFSGGEPMQQAPWLFVLMTEIRRVRPELSFGMYTGYHQKELESGKFKWKALHDMDWKPGSPQLWEQIKAMMDFAIMGRYNQALQTTEKPLCGSTNQEVVFFTDRYSLKDIPGQEVEMIIDEEGLVQITGFPVGVAI
jgi:anaerobic ribonucleoside-triphosphate reductase activating protein